MRSRPYTVKELQATPIGGLDQELLLNTLRDKFYPGFKPENLPQLEALLIAAKPHLLASRHLILFLTEWWLRDGPRNLPPSLKGILLESKIPQSISRGVQQRIADFFRCTYAKLPKTIASKWLEPNLHVYPHCLQAAIESVSYNADFNTGGYTTTFRGVPIATLQVDLGKTLFYGTSPTKVAPLYPQLSPLFEKLIAAFNKTLELEAKENPKKDLTVIVTHYRKHIEGIASEVAKAYLQERLQTTKKPAR